PGISTPPQPALPSRSRAPRPSPSPRAPSPTPSPLGTREQRSPLIAQRVRLSKIEAVDSINVCTRAAESASRAGLTIATAEDDRLPEATGDGSLGVRFRRRLLRIKQAQRGMPDSSLPHEPAPAHIN